MAQQGLGGSRKVLQLAPAAHWQVTANGMQLREISAVIHRAVTFVPPARAGPPQRDEQGAPTGHARTAQARLPVQLESKMSVQGGPEIISIVVDSAEG